MAVERTSLSEQVFKQLVDSVVSGTYEPGDRMPTQRALAADLGVNIASVREGIKRLEQLKLVDVRHGDSMRVNDWRTQGALDVLAYVAVDPDVVTSLFEARRLLLTEAARMAATRRSYAQALALIDARERFEKAQSDQEAQFADLAFFGVIIEAAGNLVFRMIMNSIAELYVQRLDLFGPLVSGREELVDLYRRTHEAVMLERPDDAAAAVAELAAAQEERMLVALAAQEEERAA